ncbi:MAG TPA: sulfatase [Candidatus Limnocylindrales bacterium]|nr:sulfatase [Candidatus Limnocylindrales bacterium]
MAAPPNVVMIVADTFRRDHLGASGNSWIRTPNLDRLAARSVVFDEHRISSFPTMPARADFLTGRFSYTFMGWEPLPPGLETLPGMLSRAGYLTMGVVDTPFFIRDGYGYDRGFDDFIWIRGQGDDTRPHERADARAMWRSERDRLVARTMTAADDWLERHHRAPFFLYVDTWDPHEPWDPPDYYPQLYRPDFTGPALYPAYAKWKEAGLRWEDVENAHAAYAGKVTMVDRWIGVLLDKLEVLGLADNTIVVFTSDHGHYFGEHGYFGKAEWIHDPDARISDDAEVPTWFSKSWLLTIGWSPLYQELARVPFLLRVPGVEPGRRRALTTAPDIPATILDLLRIDQPAQVQGRSLSRVLRGEEEEHRPFVISSWPLYFAKGELTSAVDSRRRKIASYMPVTVSTRERSLIMGGPSEPPELYDLVRDPQETTNVWSQSTGEGRRLFQSAIDFLRECGTAERFITPREESLKAFAHAG